MVQFIPLVLYPRWFMRGGGIPDIGGEILDLVAFAAGARVLSGLTLRRGAW